MLGYISRPGPLLQSALRSFFASMLMLHNGIAVYGYFAMAPLYSDELLPYFAGIHMAELVGLIALLKVTVWPEGLKTTKAAS